MGKRRVVIEVAFDVDDFLAGAHWAIGTVPVAQMNGHLVGLVRRSAEQAVKQGSSPDWLDLLSVGVAREGAIAGR